jgi:hypothetical protein
MAVIGKSAGEAVIGVSHAGAFEYTLIDII